MRYVFKLALLLTIVAPIDLFATTWLIQVDGFGDAASIQAGIDSAVAGDTVSVAPGTYYEEDIILKNDVVLNSVQSDPATVVVDAQQLGRVFFGINLDSTTVIEGITITGGLADTYPDTAGGGIYMKSSAAVIRNSIIRSNLATRGGGIAIFNGSNPKFIDCIIDSNEAYDRGGGLVSYYNSAVIEDCVFRANKAPKGGGFFGSVFTVDLRSTRMVSNEATSDGGAVFLYSNNSIPSSFRNCRFDSNFAYWGGGGIYTNVHSGLEVVSCTLSHNYTTDTSDATAGGGAIKIWQAHHIEVDSCVLSDNSGSKSAGAISSFGSQSVISNSLFLNNTAPFWGGAIYGIDADSFSVSDCQFVGNSAGSAGGALVLSWQEQGDFLRCTFSGNSSLGYGGAINTQYNLNIESSIFNANVADYGAVIYFSGPWSKGTKLVAYDSSCSYKDGRLVRSEYTSRLSEKLIRNTTLVGNTAYVGDILYQGEGDLQLENCLIAFNGSGIPITCAGTSTTTASCTDIFGNDGGDWIGCLAGQELLNNNFSSDPLFCDTASGDYTLDAASPCLNVSGCGLVGAYGEGCDIITLISDAELSIPDNSLLFQNTPNPFNPTTTIKYALAQTSQVRLTVYDVTGRFVACLVNEQRKSGYHSSVWDGKASDGQPVRSGIYFLHFETKGFAANKKITLIR